MRYKNNPISCEDASRAIYIDYEGRGKVRGQEAPSPSVCGIYIEGEYQLYVFDRKLRDLASANGHLYYECTADFNEMVVNRSKNEERRIVYWSSHERTEFQSSGHCIEKVGFDLKKPAKPYFKEIFKQYKDNRKEFESKSTSKSKKKVLRPQAFGLLSHISTSIGLNRPGSYGAGLVGSWMRLMQEQGEKKESYSNWSKGVKRKATLLLKHNEYDCRSTKFVLLHLLKQQNGPLK